MDMNIPIPADNGTPTTRPSADPAPTETALGELSLSKSSGQLNLGLPRARSRMLERRAFTEEDWETREHLHAETLALNYGYDPFLSEGAVKAPIFMTSTFQFHNAEEGKRYFEMAYELTPEAKSKKAGMGLIYSRLNNPNVQIFEERMAAWDHTQRGLAFASGMAAISTTLLALVEPGDHIIATNPVYGGTHYFLTNILPRYNIHTTFVPAGNSAPEKIRAAAEEIGLAKVRMIYVETPANPSMMLTDIEKVSLIAQEISVKCGHEGGDGKGGVITAIDNTFMGPVFLRPAHFGADLILYSATKFIGGHSDLIAGVATGRAHLMEKVATMRTMLGTVVNPFTGWLLIRSLETVSIRMQRQAKTARHIARMLQQHPAVSSIRYPNLLKEDDPQLEIFLKQCTGPGSLISFNIRGGEKEAFKVLNAFKIFRLAVSLGGTESLVEHPMSMTHADVTHEELESIGVTEGTIRMSVGVEHMDDLMADVQQALDQLISDSEKRCHDSSTY